MIRGFFTLFLASAAFGWVFFKEKSLFWAGRAAPGWRAAAASGIRDTSVNCLKIWDLVAVSQVLAGILRLLTWSSSWIPSFSYGPCVACHFPCPTPSLEGRRRWEGSPGTVAVMSRLVLAHCFGGIYGCRYMDSVCISGVSPWSSIHVSGCSGAGALGWVGGCSELPPL